MNRRDFFIWSSLAGVTAARQRGPALRMVLLTPADTPETAAAMGIRMGVEEAERAALLFGGDVQLTALEGDARLMATARALRDLVRRERPTTVFGGVASEECAALAELAERQGFLYLNVTSSDDALRGAACRATTFHVMPSAAMYRDALARAEPPVDSSARCVAWDASLVRFGADTLNQRFQARYRRPMTGDAWTGWLAVKMLWEAALRARTPEPAVVGAVLSRKSTRFDGHKGRALSFRPWDHQLRQPVYVLIGGSGAPRTVEVPVAQNTSTSSTALLDELGVSSERSSCRWAR